MAVAVVAVALASGGGGHASRLRTVRSTTSASGHARQYRPPDREHELPSTAPSRVSADGQARHAKRVPILMYHVINPPPAGAPFPGLYVEPSEFAAQMQALANAGYHAITQDQMWAYWKRGVALPAGEKPIVVSFDNGYQSQYTNALPVLRRTGLGRQ